MTRRLSPALLVLACLVALWPLPLVVGSEALGHPYGDLADHYWGTWWFGGELLAGRLPLQTNLSHYPEVLDLWYVDPLGALLALPLRALGFPTAWNLLVLGQVLAATFAAWTLGRWATRDHGAALVAAMVAGPSAYALGLVHSGLSEYLGLAPVILATWGTLRALGIEREGGSGRPWSAGLWLGIAGWQAPYHLAFGALLLLALIPGAGWRERLRPSVVVGLVALAVSAPAVAGSLLAVGDGAAVTMANAPGWTGRLPATDLLTFVAPWDHYFPDTPANGNPGILHVNSLGLVTLGLAVLGGWSATAGAGLRYGVWCLGPRLAVAKWIATVGGTSVLLPLGFLYFPGSPFAMIHQPYRLVAFLLPILAVLAARGALRLPAPLRPMLAALILGETLLASPVAWPLATRPIEAPLAPEVGPRLDWPPDASTKNRDYLVDAVAHGQPIPYGVNVFLSETLRRDPLVDQLLRSLGQIDRRARNRDVPFAGRILLRPDGNRTRLPDWGFRWIVVHPDALTDAEWGKTESLLRRAFGEPVKVDGEVWVWAVR